MPHGAAVKRKAASGFVLFRVLSDNLLQIREKWAHVHIYWKDEFPETLVWEERENLLSLLKYIIEK